MKSNYEIRNKINRRYWYAEFIKKLIWFEHNEEQKLLLIKYLLHYNCTHIMGRYSDGWLERQIIQLGQKKIKFRKDDEEQKGTVLFVMTAVSSIGGHTAMVNNWIQFDSKRKYTILLTDCDRKAVPDFLVQSVHKSGGKIKFLRGRNDYIKAERLLKISQCFEKIILFTHMYDIIPVLAYSNIHWNKPIYFFNHANFLFSVGVSIADCFLNLGDYDLVKAKKYREAKNVKKLYYPIHTIDVPKELVNLEKMEVRENVLKEYGITDLKYLIVSMGDDFKYKEIPGYDFKGFVEKLLQKAPEGTYFFIIGADKEQSRWKELYKNTKGKGIALGRLERNKVSRLLYAADTYVVSFPMSAAGFEEAWEYKVPIFILNVTNRTACHFNKKICYNSVDTMIEDIIDVLCIPTKYNVNRITAESCHQYREEWLLDLEKIFLEKLEHKVHSFEGKKIISKEELINAQLLNNTNMYPFKEKGYLNCKYLWFIRLIEKIEGDISE